MAISKADKISKSKATPTTIPCKHHKMATTRLFPKTRKAKQLSQKYFPPKPTPYCQSKNLVRPTPSGSKPSSKATSKAKSKSRESSSHMPKHSTNFKIKLLFLLRKNKPSRNSMLYLSRNKKLRMRSFWKLKLNLDKIRRNDKTRKSKGKINFKNLSILPTGKSSYKVIESIDLMRIFIFKPKRKYS
jgi:hypothetical protein